MPSKDAATPTDLRERRNEIRRRIQDSERKRSEIAVVLSTFPPMPHDGVTEYEIGIRNDYARLAQEIARLSEEFSSLTLETVEAYLAEMSTDGKKVRWLTLVLVILTGILGVETLVLILRELGR